MNAVTQNSADILLDMIQRVATGGGSADAVKELVAARERAIARDAKIAFDTALADFKAKVSPILKNKHAEIEFEDGGKEEFDYATLDNIVETVVPTLSQFGFSHTWRMEQAGGLVRVFCVARHLGGHSEETQLEAPADDSDGMNGAQAVGSTTSYLERYTFLAAFGLATKDKDVDGHAADRKPVRDVITAEQVAELQAELAAAGANEGRFCKSFRIEALADLRATDFDAAKRIISQKKAA